MRTLHIYFGRELFKTFLMTSLALTLLVVMGGGVANLFRGEGVGAGQMVKIFLFLGPVAITLILPVAALFSSTITYGRCAYDNEILACRAAGVNIHRLLLMPFLLGLGVTIFTFISWNYMIPYLTRSIYEITRRDLPSIVIGQFQKAKPLVYGKYRIMADHCEIVPTDQLPKPFRDDHTFLRLLEVTFLEVENQNFVRYGTADETILDFDSTSSIPRVTVDMQGVRSFDAAHKVYSELKHKILGPIDIPLPIKRKIKYENLNTLKEFRKDPLTIPEIQDLLHGMRRAMMTLFLNQDIENHMIESSTYHLKGHDFDLALSAAKYVVDDEDGRIRLGEVHAQMVPTSGGPVTHYAADNATVELRSGLQEDRPVILVDLIGQVRIHRTPADRDDRIIKKAKVTLPSLNYHDQAALLSRYQSFDITTLFDVNSEVPLYRKQQRMQSKLIKRVRSYASEVQGEIYFRSSYSLGAVAIVLLGAILGIIVRGGQVLTAFGISCVPMLIVIVASIVGRNLADRPTYATLSACVMWGSTVFMFTASAFVAAKFLRR